MARKRDLSDEATEREGDNATARLPRKNEGKKERKLDGANGQQNENRVATYYGR